MRIFFLQTPHITTDLESGGGLFPLGFFASSRPATTQKSTQRGERKQEQYESTDSTKKSNSIIYRRGLLRVFASDMGR
jgi:hypothetical protein